MTVATGDILQVRAKYSYGPDDYMNVYHLQASFAASQTDEDVYDTLAAWVETIYQPIDNYMPTGCVFQSIEINNLTQAVTLGDEPWPTLTAGSAADSPNPLQTAAVARFTTTTQGSQGRKFFGPFTEAVIGNAGLLDGSLATAVGNAGTAALTAAVVSAGNTLVAGNWNELLTRFVEWAAVIVNDRLGTQRRRSYGVGE